MKQGEEPQTVNDNKSESFEKMTIKLASQGCKCPETAVLKLKIINLSSQNYTLKRKIAELSESLKSGRSYEIAFGNVVKVTRQLMRKQGVSESRVSEELNNIVKGQEGYQQSILTMNKEMLLTTKQSNTEKMTTLTPLKTQYQPSKHFPQSDSSGNKINENHVLSRLTENDERETIKSLDLSFDSRTSVIQKQKQVRQNQLQIVRRDYESVRESLETVYNMKTRLVLQELEELRSQNQQLKSRLNFVKQEEKFHQEDKEEETETNGRETAYFPTHYDRISQQEHEESIGGDRSSNSSMHSCTFPFTQQFQIQKLPSLSQQIKSLKQTLEKLHYLFTSLSPELMQILDTFYALKKVSKEIKIISLDEYILLLSCKKQETVQNSQCRANEKEIERLKNIVRQFI